MGNIQELHMWLFDNCNHRGATLETTTAIKSVKTTIFTIFLCTAVALWYLKPVSQKKLQLGVTV